MPRVAHPFLERPHGTFLSLSFPVLLSLLVEPLAGVADTAFVARLGSVPAAALGAATSLLSGFLWVFNFVGIGTQTEVAAALGRGERNRAAGLAALGLSAAAACGIVSSVALWFLAPAAARFMAAVGELEAPTVAYLRVRLLGVPPTLVVLAAFGAFRGMQDMKTPLWIAAFVSGLNICLDPLLIYGSGCVPGLGVAGAAWATTASQWLGSFWAVRALRVGLGLAGRFGPGDFLRLLRIGRDLFLRTGMLLLFLVLATRAATGIGPETGAAHQAIRQAWILTALVLDSYAATAQSLVGFFLGGGRVREARRAAGIACLWGLLTGAGLSLLMLATGKGVAWLLVPTAAGPVFFSAWPVAALAQPLNALAFVTDGIHWGASDYGYLRNAMMLATVVGASMLLALEAGGNRDLAAIWWVTAGWIAIRAVSGVGRIWPAFGRAPLAGR
ncbi:MAG: hypothetical protein KatS3mg076_2087 [Candidatus Binatia bacterium]|nr:MAG: hypothetical protein KatS3mg076_2087 [Candidatus Binatia bacterium]